MEFRTSARDKDLALGFHKLIATDSAQAVQPLRRVTQAAAETVYRTADPYTVAGWNQGSGDDYSDRAATHMRSGAPRYGGHERTAARPANGAPTAKQGYSATPSGWSPAPSGQPAADPAGTAAAGTTATTSTTTGTSGGATTGAGSAHTLVREVPAGRVNPGTPLDHDGPLHKAGQLAREGVLVDDLDGPRVGHLPLRTAATPEGDAHMPPTVSERKQLLARAGRRGTARGSAPALDPTAPVARVGKAAGRGKATTAGRAFGPGRGALGGNLRRGRLAAAGASRAADAAPTGISAVTRLVGLPTGTTQGANALANVTTLLVQQGQRAVAAVVAGLAGTSGAVLGVGAAVILAILAVVVAVLPWLQWQHEQESGGAMLTGAIAAGTPGLPAELIPLYNKAGATCPDMPPTLLAAQGARESGFNTNAVSPVGAKGVSQFMDGTWASYGKDANGDGVASPFDPADAIDAQARYMCDLAVQVTTLKEQGKVVGDVQTLALSAYNAGIGAVQRAGGVPPYAETAAYAPAILAGAQAFGGSLAAGGDLIVATGDYAGVISTLKARIGTPYSWGGGNVNGPTRGFAQGASTVGWDCSSFVQYGFYQGTGGKVLLPRTAAAQGAATSAHTVPRDALQPGDLLFWGSRASSAHHVAMYIGGGQMIEEPRTGLSARITPLQADFVSAARVPLS
ncbi:C40 family peptidase [Arsenicicoccus bolidensis]|uniref:C40 family peptidase n=1 Tax=Arsenicicoccus bolidensis TaxID=229480 RepID=UPI0028B0AB49|nr:NlpC/P60 family protein [Arsenicicoccus bolidensis]